MASDGNEAIKFFLEHSYSIIFLDLHMPEMNGIDTLHKIKKIEKNKGLSPTPVVCLSGSSFQAEIDLCLSSGFDDYIEKPFDRETLLKTINKFTGNSSVQQDFEKIKIDESILDLMPAYLENRKADIEKIKKALKADDMPAIESLAHKMKGSGASYGFERITHLGKQIESSAKENDRDQILLNVKELELFLENVQYE